LTNLPTLNLAEIKGVLGPLISRFLIVIED